MHYMNPSYGPLPEICMIFEAPKNFFFAVAKKTNLNASFIIYTYIHTIYIYMYKYIKSFKHEVNRVLIRQMHFHIFYFQDTN